MGTVLPIAFSVVALGFSIYVFIDSRRRDRRDVFLKIHELLISNDLQRGRYLLFQRVTDEASVQKLSDQEYRDVNRALATYETLGLYLENGYVSKRDVMDIWAEAICRAWHVGQPFIAHRERNHGYRPWPHFEALARAAEANLASRGVAMKYPALRESRDSQL